MRRVGRSALGILVAHAAKATPFSFGAWSLVGVAALLSVASFATGGLVSAIESSPVAVLWIHRVGGWVTVAVLAALLGLVDRTG